MQNVSKETRDKKPQIPLSAPERKLLGAAARSMGLGFAPWARSVLIQEARRLLGRIVGGSR